MRLRFERAIATASEGAEAEQVAEALLEGADLAEVLEAEHWASLAPTVRLEASLQAAWLAAERQDDELTLSAATRALELEPANERALAIAEPLWLESESFAELADRYALAATATAAGSEERARQLLERALHMLQGLPAATPAVVGLSERLAQLPRLRDAEESLLAVLKSGGAEANSALLKLGERWLKDGRARDGAQVVPRDLSAFQGDAALDILERLFDQAEDVERLEEVLQKRVEVAANAAARGRALDKLAELEHEKRGDLAAAAGAWLAAAQAFLEAGERDDAERAYERLLQMLPEHLNAAARLVELRAGAGNFAGVTEAFAVLLRADADAPQAAELLLRIAGDAERASAADELSELVESVQWRLTAEDRALSDRLLRESARLFAAQDRDDEAAELYRRLLADSAAPEDVRTFQALIDSNPASDWRQSQQRWLFEWREHEDADRATVLFEWASFEETEIGDPAAAALVLARAAELAPDRTDIWRNLAKLRFAGGDVEGGLAAAERLRHLGYELDPELLSSVLEQDPSARWAVDRLKLSLSAEARWPELFELYDRAIAGAASAEERARWLDEAAIAARDVAQDHPRAVRYWEDFIELAPEDARVDSALERLYERAGDRASQIAHLERRLARSTPDQRLVVEPRIARLALELGAVDDALAAVRRLKELDTGAAEPLLEATFARCTELWAQPAARSCGLRCAEVLRSTYAEQAKPAEVARVLRAELSLELEFRERCERLSTLSQLCERDLFDLPGSFEAARQAFLATAAEPERKRLEELTQKLGAWSELVEAYLEGADSELKRPDQRRLLRRAADISRERLEDASLATRCYEALFALEPDAARGVFEELGTSDASAFEALCRVLSRAQRFEQLARALQERATSLGEPSLYSRLARLQADELNDPRSAIESHLQASDARAAAEVFLRQPSVFGEETPRALALASMLDAVGLPEGALRVLRHQLAFFGEHFSPARKPAQLALAQALEASGDHDAAYDLLREAAKRYPADVEAQRAGAAGAAARRDWERAEQGYRTLLLLLHGEGADTTTLRRATVYVELAAIKQQRQDEAAARQLVESGFEVALDHPEELLALTRALLAHEMWEPAERAAAQLLEHGDDARAVAQALIALSELRVRERVIAPATQERAERAAVSAVATRGERGDAVQRSTLLTASLSFLPLEEAERLLSGAEGELTKEDAARARVELARRLLDRGDEASRVEATTRLKALVTHPDAPSAAWQLLARAWELSGDTTSLATALDGWLARHPRDRHVLSRSLELALQQGELARALDHYQRLEQEGADLEPEQRLRLSALCVDGGKPELAASLLHRAAEREPKPLKRAALLVEAAELRLASEDVPAAEALANEARAVDPASPEATLLLARLRVGAGGRDEARRLLDGYLEGKERRRGKGLSRCLRLAADLRLSQDELGEALPLLIEAHQLDKTDLDTALLLGLLALDMDRLETAASALRVLIAQHEHGAREGTTRQLNFAQGYLQLARIEQHHGKKTNAKRMALRALEENPHLAAAKQLLDELTLH